MPDSVSRLGAGRPGEESACGQMNPGGLHASLMDEQANQRPEGHHDPGPAPLPTIRIHPSARRSHLRGQTRGRHRLPGTQRSRQVHRDAHHGRAQHSQQRPGADRGPPLPRAPRAAADGRSRVGRQRFPPVPHRTQPPRVSRCRQPAPQGARARGARSDRARRRRWTTGRPVLARDETTPRHRRGTPGRPTDPDPRRTEQRPRPRRDHLAPRPAHRPRRRGAHRAGLEPPHHRGGTQRRTPPRDRPRSPARRRSHRGPDPPGRQPPSKRSTSS